MEVYLKIENPFDFSSLTKYKNRNINIVGLSTMVFLYNIALQFPEIVSNITIDKVTWDGDGSSVNEVPISVLPSLVDKYKKLLKYTEDEDSSGEKYKSGYVKGEVVEYDYSDSGGEKGSYIDYEELGKWLYKTPREELEIGLIIDVIEKYEGIKPLYHIEGYMTRNPIITDTIKKYGYDGIIQSKYDEAVVFNPNQIKSVDSVNFDINSNNIYENFKTEYIDINKTDLKKDFDYLNKLMFDNKLIPIKLEWFKNKNIIGLATFVGNQAESIKISIFFKMTRKQYMEVLAHEMVHVFMHQQGINDSTVHGNKFIKFINDLNKKFPEFNIKPTEDASYYTVNNNIKKPIGVIVFTLDDNDYMGIFVDRNIIDNSEILSKFVADIQKYIERVPNNIFVRNKKVVMDFYKGDNPELSKFKIKRVLSMSNLQFSDIKEQDLMKIQEGELLQNVKIKG